MTADDNVDNDNGNGIIIYSGQNISDERAKESQSGGRTNQWGKNNGDIKLKCNWCSSLMYAFIDVRASTRICALFFVRAAHLHVASFVHSENPHIHTLDG